MHFLIAYVNVCTSYHIINIQINLEYHSNASRTSEKAIIAFSILLHYSGNASALHLINKPFK